MFEGDVDDDSSVEIRSVISSVERCSVVKVDDRSDVVSRSMLGDVDVRGVMILAKSGRSSRCGRTKD